MALRGTPPHTPGHLFSYIPTKNGGISSMFPPKFLGENGNQYRAANPEITLQGISISHLGKRKIIFKMPFLGDMLVPWRVPLQKKSPQSPRQKKRFSSQLTMTTVQVGPPRNTASRIAQASPMATKATICGQPYMLDSEVWAGDLAFLRNQKNVILVEKWLKKHTHTHSTWLR